MPPINSRFCIKLSKTTFYSAAGDFLRLAIKSVITHARSKKVVLRDRNALHPGLEGGYQLGDAIYCWLRKQLEAPAAK